MSERAARTPFPFLGCWELQEMLGRRAYDERELLEHLEEGPLDSIYFHTHRVFLRKRGLPGPYRHDFATWVDEQLGLPELAAAMARLNPFPFGVEEVRRRLVALCDAVLTAGA